MNQTNDTNTILNSNLAFTVILSLQSVILFVSSAFSLLLNSILLDVFRRNKIFDKNIRYISLHLCLAVLTHACYTLCQSLYNVVYLGDRNFYVMNMCKTLNSFNYLALGAIIGATSLLAMQQYSASHGLKSVAVAEVGDHVSAWVVVATLVIWLFGALETVPVFMYQERTLRKYCHSVLRIDIVYLWPGITIFVVMELMNIGAYVLLYAKSKVHFGELGVSAARSDLHNRFQLSQNIQTNRVFVPSSIGQFVCFTLSLTLVYFVKLLPAESPEAISVLMINVQLLSCYHVMHPLLSIRLNATLKKETIKYYPNMCIVFGIKTKNLFLNSNDSNTGKRIIEFRRQPHETVNIIENIWNKKNSSKSTS